MQTEILILISVLLGFLMGRFKGSTDEVGQSIKQSVSSVFDGVRKIRYEKKDNSKTTPWA